MSERHAAHRSVPGPRRVVIDATIGNKRRRSSMPRQGCPSTSTVQAPHTLIAGDLAAPTTERIAQHVSGQHSAGRDLTMTRRAVDRRGISSSISRSMLPTAPASRRVSTFDHAKTIAAARETIGERCWQCCRRPFLRSWRPAPPTMTGSTLSTGTATTHGREYAPPIATRKSVTLAGHDFRPGIDGDVADAGCRSATRRIDAGRDDDIDQQHLLPTGNSFKETVRNPDVASAIGGRRAKRKQRRHRIVNAVTRRQKVAADCSGLADTWIGDLLAKASRCREAFSATMSILGEGGVGGQRTHRDRVTTVV